MRLLTWARRTCYTAAALLFTFGLAAPSLVDAQESTAPGTFGASGFATPIQALLNTEPQTFVADLLRLDVPHGQSRFGADGQSSARSASIFPGVGATEGPALAWGQACSQGFPCDEFFPEGGFPPPNPLVAEAENPTRPEARPTFEGQQVGEPGGPVSFTIVDVVARATAEEASTQAVIADFDFLPSAGSAQNLMGLGGTTEANPSAVHVGELRATTRLRVEGNTLVAEAESRLDDVSLFGGALEIERVVARSVSRATADGTLENAPEVTVVGATAGGRPVKITDEGVVADGGTVDQGAVPILSGGVGTLFGAGPASVRLVDVTDDSREGTARGDAVGLMVSFRVNASGFPGGVTVLGNLMLGTASTSAFAGSNAFSEDDLVFDDAFFGDDFTATDSGTGGFTGGGTDFGGDTEVAGETEEALPEPQAEPAAPEPQPALGPLELLGGAAAERMQLLYGAWTAGLALLALGSRLRPFRLTV